MALTQSSLTVNCRPSSSLPASRRQINSAVIVYVRTDEIERETIISKELNEAQSQVRRKRHHLSPALHSRCAQVAALASSSASLLVCGPQAFLGLKMDPEGQLRSAGRLARLAQLDESIKSAGGWLVCAPGSRRGPDPNEFGRHFSQPNATRTADHDEQIAK